ncbi:MAG TPA: RNase adapter RapZ [Ignavibacteria bacterium]
MLTVKIYSFSYLRSGIPVDDSGNGGGFVFDCRFIFNPGKFQQFKNLTGKDKEVIDVLDSKPGMQVFLSDTESIIGAAIINYLERDFNHLMVSFGCTGGQHRSVYSAEKIKEYIKSNFPQVNVEINHNEFPC